MFDFLMSLARRLPKRLRHRLSFRTGQLLNRFPRTDVQMLQQTLMLYVGLKEGIEFKSQYCQDMLAYAYFKAKRDGFFVDIGAHDGVLGSNTFVFEKLGWKGFCVEPNPEIFKLLRKNRICDSYEFAVTESSGETVDFLRFKGVGTDSQHSAIVNPTLCNLKLMSATEIVKVKTITFSELMDRYPGVTNIDLLSLDTEGCELQILRTIDFNRYQFGLLAIEANSPEVPNFLASKGYRLLTQPWGDGLFVQQ